MLHIISTLKECPHTGSGRLLQSRYIRPLSIRGYLRTHGYRAVTALQSDLSRAYVLSE
ncbi:MAG: hypothetical protein IJL54_11095 [Prevotella sp.]|nr:hypothetical protein [Prevotella sp.]